MDKEEKEMKETVLWATEAERCNKRVRICNGTAMFLLLIYNVVKETSLYGNPTVVTGLDFVQGIAVGMLLVGLLFSSRYGAKIRAFKNRLIKRQG